MTAESAGASARDIDQHHVERTHRRIPRITYERQQVDALQSALICQQPLQPTERPVAGDDGAGKAR